MQRLFSTFARGAPGAGLLLLRIVGGASAITHSVADLGSGVSVKSAPDILALAAGALLALGVWTPVCGAVLAALEVGAILSAHPDGFSGILSGPGLLPGTIGAALALLGPGAWSIDAWRFGWRRIDVHNDLRDRKS